MSLISDVQRRDALWCRVLTQAHMEARAAGGQPPARSIRVRDQLKFLFGERLENMAETLGDDVDVRPEEWRREKRVLHPVGAMARVTVGEIGSVDLVAGILRLSSANMHEDRRRVPGMAIKLFIKDSPTTVNMLAMPPSALNDGAPVPSWLCKPHNPFGVSYITNLDPITSKVKNIVANATFGRVAMPTTDLDKGYDTMMFEGTLSAMNIANAVPTDSFVQALCNASWTRDALFTYEQHGRRGQVYLSDPSEGFVAGANDLLNFSHSFPRRR